MEKKTFLKQNLLKLKESDELLYAELEHFDFDSYDTQNVTMEKALEGSDVIKIEKNSYEWYFNSKFEPVKVVNQWIDHLGKIESIATIVIYGLGNGMLLREFLKKTGENVVFIIYEPSVDIFLKTLNEIDLSFIERRVFILVEGINDIYFEGVFESFISYENISVCKFIGHPNYWSCFQEEAMNYLNRLQGMIKQLDIICQTKLSLCEGYYKNVLMNLRYLDSVSVIDQMFNKVGIEIPDDMPAIVVSAGPSLSKNVKELKNAKGKAFIIATDSALKGMLDEGIIPDAFATIDPLKPLNRFEDERIHNIPLFCTESGRFEIVERNRDKKIFANNFFGFGNTFFNMQGKEYLVSEHGGSVATFSFTVARMMGFKTIILIGQDLAFTDDTRYYNSVKEWNDHDTLPQHLYAEVEDIHGNMVRTSKDMEVYLEWFEKQIEYYDEVEVIDATEGGAKIHGTKIMNLAIAIQEKCRTEFDMTEYIRKIPNYANETDKEEFEKFVKRIPVEYENLHQDAIIGIDLYEKLINMIKLKADNNLAIKETAREISEITKRVEENLVYFHIQHKLEKAEYTILNNLGVSLEDKVEDALQVAGRGKQILEVLRQILEDEVLAEVKQVIDTIKFESK